MRRSPRNDQAKCFSEYQEAGRFFSNTKCPTQAKPYPYTGAARRAGGKSGETAAWASPMPVPTKWSFRLIGFRCCDT
jgi:hypothetical protein